jgi:serine protease Do
LIRRTPAWLAYPSLLLALVWSAIALRPHVDAPAPPPPVTSDAAAAFMAAPIDPALLTKVRPGPGPNLGAAVSVGDHGAWLTTRRALSGCASPAVMVSDTEGALVRPAAANGAVVALTSPSGAPALPLFGQAVAIGEPGYLVGYFRGRPGEVAVRLMGSRPSGTGAGRVLVWAEIGRTEGLAGALDGIAGAPVLDASGRVVGLALAEAPRLGRIYASTPQETIAAAPAGVTHAAPGDGLAIAPDNYGLEADDLRRALSIAPLACASR